MKPETAVAELTRDNQKLSKMVQAGRMWLEADDARAVAERDAPPDSTRVLTLRDAVSAAKARFGALVGSGGVEAVAAIRNPEPGEPGNG